MDCQTALFSRLIRARVGLSVAVSLKSRTAQQPEELRGNEVRPDCSGEIRASGGVQLFVQDASTPRAVYNEVKGHSAVTIRHERLSVVAVTVVVLPAVCMMSVFHHMFSLWCSVCWDKCWKRLQLCCRPVFRCFKVTQCSHELVFTCRRILIKATLWKINTSSWHQQLFHKQPLCLMEPPYSFIPLQKENNPSLVCNKKTEAQISLSSFCKVGVIDLPSALRFITTHGYYIHKCILCSDTNYQLTFSSEASTVFLCPDTGTILFIVSAAVMRSAFSFLCSQRFYQRYRILFLRCQEWITEITQTDHHAGQAAHFLLCMS